MKPGTTGICRNCKQPILQGQSWGCSDGEDFHDDPSDCVAATARRCAEIGREVQKRCPDFIGKIGCDAVIDAIEDEFKLEPTR